MILMSDGYLYKTHSSCTTNPQAPHLLLSAHFCFLSQVPGLVPARFALYIHIHFFTTVLVDFYDLFISIHTYDNALYYLPYPSLGVHRSDRHPGGRISPRVSSRTISVRTHIHE